MAGDEPTAFQSLRYLLFGGETCDPKWVRIVLELGSPQNLVHVYGPTENTTFTTWHRVERVGSAATTVPIGRPIANSHVYLLDGTLQPVPVGVIGEVYIGGDGLARGYLNRPELTAETFIRNPFSSDPWEKLYKTGDFARYLHDGSVDFAGRADRQIKLRGFRIELQDIEAALSHHPDVSQSLAITRHRDRSDQSIVAYVVPRHGAQPPTDALRRFLREKLPEYMIPSAFLLLESLPLTPHGKVDYAALPAPEQARREETPSFVAPRTAIERGIAEIWEGVLGVQRVGLHDDFFDLGGHSLLAIQVIARIERRLGKAVPVAVLFQSPTIAQLAEVLGDNRDQGSWSALIPIRATGSKMPFFWVHGDWSNARLAEHLGPDRPIFALEHQTSDGRPALHTEVHTIAMHYLKEVRGIRPHGPYLLGGYCFGAVTAFEMARQLTADGEEVAVLFMLDPPGQQRKTSPRVRDRVHQQIRNAGARPFAGKMAFLLLKVTAAVRDEISARRCNIIARVNRLRTKAHLRKGGRLPPSLRSGYILDVYRRALRSYTPQRYRGNAAIFKSAGPGYWPPLDWTKLITGQLEIHEERGNHTDMTTEPLVAVWAARLKTTLDRFG